MLTVHNILASDELCLFATLCKALTSVEIYVLYEDMLNDSMRDQILACAPDAAAEPVRESLNRIGKSFGVDSLINY